MAWNRGQIPKIPCNIHTACVRYHPDRAVPSHGQPSNRQVLPNDFRPFCKQEHQSIKNRLRSHHPNNTHQASRKPSKVSIASGRADITGSIHSVCTSGGAEKKLHAGRKKRTLIQLPWSTLFDLRRCTRRFGSQSWRLWRRCTMWTWKFWSIQIRYDNILLLFDETT